MELFSCKIQKIPTDILKTVSKHIAYKNGKIVGHNYLTHTWPDVHFLQDVLSRPAEEFENDQSVEAMWAMKAYEHAEIYFNVSFLF